MKLLHFDDSRIGVLKDGRVVDVTAMVLAAPGREQAMQSVIEGFGSLEPRLEEIASRESGVPLSNVTLHPPVSRPSKVLCAFANYQDRTETLTVPLDFFYKGPTSVLAPGGTVELPDIPEASVFQPEPELGFVIGRRAKHVKEADALSFVFGYINFIDISAREVPNRRTTFLTKGLDTWAPMGPVITTRDEIPDPQNLRVRLWLNDELKQDYSTAAMTNSVAAQIAWLSQYVTLEPGDVISCGAHHIGLSPINDGDRVAMEVDGLERLEFNVRSHGPRKTAEWRPPNTRRA